MKETTETLRQSMELATAVMGELLYPNPMKGRPLREVLEVIAQGMLQLNASYTASQQEVMTADETTSFLQVKRGTLMKMTMNKEIPYYKIGKHIYFKKEELREWLQLHRVATKAEIADKAGRYVRNNPRCRS